MKNKNKIESKAKRLWGKDLHKNKSAPAHSPQLENIFQDEWGSSLKGDLLEIGCGSGSDLEIFSNLTEIKTITAIDLGENIEKLAQRYIERNDISIVRGNALSLDFEDKKFDVIYSFGVFHHTADPIQCISEANRVLKKNGAIFLYLYSSHEDLLLKRAGIFFERSIMNFFQYIPYSIQNLICIMLSPICWAAFIIPSKILKFLGFEVLSRRFPFYFGSHPFSVIDDLKDRLISPINFRFSKLEIEKILQSSNFSFFEVVKTSSGLYIFAKK
tara:strand:- start:54 stop:869 length:816 start_codon:yes stop_codon:yes gene_type:complete